MTFAMESMYLWKSVQITKPANISANYDRGQLTCFAEAANCSDPGEINKVAYFLAQLLSMGILLCGYL